MSEYPHSKKKKLVEKIEKLTERKDLLKVKDIIFEHNPDLSSVKNATGILLYFHKLTVPTYQALEKFLNKKLLKECAKSVKNINTMESVVSSEMNVSSTGKSTGTGSGSKKKKSKKKEGYRYSNKEKNIMRRNNYEKTLNEQNGTETVTVDFEKYNRHKEYDNDSTNSSNSESSEKNVVKSKKLTKTKVKGKTTKKPVKKTTKRSTKSKKENASESSDEDSGEAFGIFMKNKKN